MFYVVSFDGCGVESPLESKTPEDAVRLGRAAEQNGCENVVVMVPGAGVLTLNDFSQRYCAAKGASPMPDGS